MNGIIPITALRKRAYNFLHQLSQTNKEQ